MKETPLLIIDLQVGFNPEKVLVDLIQDESNKRKYVFQTVFRKGNPLFQTVLNWIPEESGLAPCLPNTGKIFEKTGYGIPELMVEELISFQRVDICGMGIDACVLASAFQLWDAVIRPVILCDMCGGRKNRTAALKITERQFGLLKQNSKRTHRSF